LKLSVDGFLHYRTGKDELLDTAMALHDAAIKDEFFIKRKLAPNVDFWYAQLFSPQISGNHLPILLPIGGNTITNITVMSELIIPQLSGLIYRAMGE